MTKTNSPSEETQVQPSQFEVAAQWWANRIVDCVHSGLSDQERRDPQNLGYQMAEVLMTISRPQITPAQVDAFKAALLMALETAPHKPYGLGVDYGPDEFLAGALAAADIPTDKGTLPIKTRMYLNANGEVKASYGYGAAAKILREPDLLFTARVALRQLDEVGSVALGDLDRLRDAIAKAEGEARHG